MGFGGYLTADTGIVHNMCWGVEMLDIPERIGFAVNNAGIDVISGLCYYETHTTARGHH